MGLPEKIWAALAKDRDDPGNMFGSCWTRKIDLHNTSYTRTDLADAMVAAAYEAAAVKAQDWASQDSDQNVWSVIARMAPTDARAALDAAIAKAVAEERERCAQVADAVVARSDAAMGKAIMSDAILRNSARADLAEEIAANIRGQS